VGEPNARLLNDGDNCLFDMGAEYQCYASDITCSFPANGTFSETYLSIYNAVLQAQITVYDMARPGVSWVACHKAAEVSERDSAVMIHRLHQTLFVIATSILENNFAVSFEGWYCCSWTK
jgi:Xaa-Pro dipeptidase